MDRVRCSIAALVLALALALPLTGCTSRQGGLFAMDTYMTFTAYGLRAEAALEACARRVTELEKLLSVTDVESEIYAVNHAGGQWIEVSEETCAILERALALCAETGGALDITAYPTVAAWGFTTGEYRVPDGAELEELKQKIDYTAVELDRSNHRIRLPEGMELDLGAVAKGYAGERMALTLEEYGIKSAVLSLGGSVQTLGEKPDGSPWRVGVQAPGGGAGASLAVVETAGMAVVTSGGYERFFEENAQIYWHIMDPDTAAPARSGLLSATVVGADGAACDALSTALFVMGADRAAQFWRERGGFEYALILDDGSIQISQGLEGSFTLAPGYEDRKVTVIAP